MKLTLEDMMIAVDELKQKIAVQTALVGFLRTRYVSRDGLPPQSYISYERSTVTEDVVYEVINELERLIEKQQKELNSTLKEIVND